MAMGGDAFCFEFLHSERLTAFGEQHVRKNDLDALECFNNFSNDLRRQVGMFQTMTTCFGAFGNVYTNNPYALYTAICRTPNLYYGDIDSKVVAEICDTIHNISESVSFDILGHYRKLRVRTESKDVAFFFESLPCFKTVDGDLILKKVGIFCSFECDETDMKKPFNWLFDQIITYLSNKALRSDINNRLVKNEATDGMRAVEELFDGPHFLLSVDDVFSNEQS